MKIEQLLNKTLFYCYECNVSFTTKFVMNRHFQSTSIHNIKYKCKECNKNMSYRKDVIKRHNKRFHSI